MTKRRATLKPDDVPGGWAAEWAMKFQCIVIVEQCRSTVDGETLQCVNVGSNRYMKTRQNAGDGDTEALGPPTIPIHTSQREHTKTINSTTMTKRSYSASTNVRERLAQPATRDRGIHHAHTTGT